MSSAFDVDSLAHLLARGLSVSKSTTTTTLSQSYDATRLMFHAWLTPPSPHYVNGETTIQQIVEMLNGTVSSFDIPHTSLPLLSLPTRAIQFQPHPAEEDYENKPNLVSAVVAVLLHAMKQQQQQQQQQQQTKKQETQDNGKEKDKGKDNDTHTTTTTTKPSQEQDIKHDGLADMLRTSLSQHDVIAPRHPFKVLLCDTSQTHIVYMYKPSLDMPLFIERGDRYPKQSGSIGLLFEEHLTKARNHRYQRVYSVVTATLGSLRVVLTGEADAVNDQGLVLEFKTKPSVFKEARAIQTWIQCKLTGVERVITGDFTGRKGGPVSFAPRDIHELTLPQYVQHHGLKAECEERMQAWHDLLTQMVTYASQPTHVGHMYRVECTSTRREMSLKYIPVSPRDSPFPVNNNVIDACIRGVIQHTTNTTGAATKTST